MTRAELRNELPLCGCGYPQQGAAFLYGLLKLFSEGHENRHQKIASLLPDDGLRMVVLGSIDEKGWIEHGGTIEGSWLTDEGKTVLAGLELEYEHDRFHRLFNPEAL